jgi:ABC-2 type transport system ATP-binding protein
MIEARRLHKKFGHKTAVEDVSFKVERGEVLGFLGPNAAGKSTTMRMITGYLPPTSGTAVIGGYDITTQSLQARKKIGYLPENAPVYPDMDVYSFLDFIASIRGFSGRSKSELLEKTLEKCFLTDVRHQMTATLSKGFKQRVCFAQSILHDPDYLIMDEPTDGLDPNQKHEVRTMITQMAEDKAVLLSTHNLEEVDAVCTRAVIIAQGRIVADDAPSRLKAFSPAHGAIRIVVPAEAADLVREGMEGVKGVRLTEMIEDRDDAGVSILRILPEDRLNPPADGVLEFLHTNGVRPEAFTIEQGRLDEVFRMVTSA